MTKKPTCRNCGSQHVLVVRKRAGYYYFLCRNCGAAATAIEKYELKKYLRDLF